MSRQVEFYEVIDALAGMAIQYLENGMIPMELDDDCVGAGETAIGVLQRLDLMRGNVLRPEALDIEFLKQKFPT